MAGDGIAIPFSPTLHLHLVPYIAAIHAACITHDRTIATFLPPLSHEKLLSWWKERINEVKGGTRLIYMLLSTLEPGAKLNGPDVMGVVMLSMPWSETGTFRGCVEKLLVHKTFRERRGAKTLMSALEEDALKRGRTLLLLDAETGNSSEIDYEEMGYNEFGRVPQYAKSPTGELKDGIFFWKRLQ